MNPEELEDILTEIARQILDNGLSSVEGLGGW